MTKIFVSVAEGDGARVRSAQEEVRKVRACYGTGEIEGATRILLEQIVELFTAIIATGGNGLSVMVPLQRERLGTGLIVV